jgi:hypothetical protein
MISWATKIFLKAEQEEKLKNWSKPLPGLEAKK